MRTLGQISHQNRFLGAFVRKVRAWGQALGERGQGTLEYILILVITVIIILSLLYQFHDSFRIYAEAFFDGYIRCLLETGELPGTGSVCQSEFKAFDPKAGKSLLKDNLPAGGSGGGSQSSSSNSSSSNSASKSSTPHHSETTGGGGRGSTVVGRFGGDSGRTKSVAMSKPEGGKNTATGSQDLLGASNTVPIGKIYGSPPSRAEQTESTSRTQVDDSPDDKAKKSTVIDKKADNSNGLRPKRVAEAAARGLAHTGEESHSFTIGALIRLLFIILIVVALVIFFGGQLMQISKSREKGGD